MATSRRPHLDWISLRALSTSCRLETSHRRKTADPALPAAAAARWPVSLSQISSIATRAPSSMRRRAVARPISPQPPVMRTFHAPDSAICQTYSTLHRQSVNRIVNDLDCTSVFRCACIIKNVSMGSKILSEKERKAKLSASQKVELHIKNAIYSGALKPRERVIEEDIARRLHCSRGPVREALLRLERDGLVVTIPRRGTFINDISAESIDVVFRIRGKLEGLCVRYMREQIRPKDESTLRELLRRMKAAAGKGDDEQFLQSDM